MWEPHTSLGKMHSQKRMENNLSFSPMLIQGLYHTQLISEELPFYKASMKRLRDDFFFQMPNFQQ